MAGLKTDTNNVTVFAGRPEANIETDLCTVLYGYGRVGAQNVSWVDNYKFVGGVGRNIPRSIANCWAKGSRLDGKPAISRVYIQAILPSDADESAFVQATGVQLVPPEQLAAMIKASDAGQLVELLGKSQAVALAEALMKNISPGK